MKRYHVVIVGAGLVGTACALALEQIGLRVALIEPRPPAEPAAEWDTRIYAISPGSQNLLERLGAWQRQDAGRIQPVYRMAVHGDQTGVITLDAYDSAAERLATILESGGLQWALWQQARAAGQLDIFSPSNISLLHLDQPRSRLVLEDGQELEAELVIGADGRKSWVRVQAGIQPRIKPYGQLGVVANFSTEKPHHGTAFQWFREDGVLAWLPLPGNRMSMVWSTPELHAGELVSMQADALCEQVASAGGNRLGRLSLLNTPAGFPLSLMTLPEICMPGMVLVGDAAHGVHPLAGQGVNLGFGDVESIAAILAGRGRAGCGDMRVLARHARARSEPVWRMRAATDGLHRLFDSPGKLPGTLRNLGMSITNRVPFAKSALIRGAMTIIN
jgi:2-octaprenylphenol hydroxylase